MSKKVYVVLWDDTHSETTAHPFSTAEKAIEYARKSVASVVSHPDDIEEETIPNFLYFARYSSESSIWVIETELDDGDS
jgi:hypothetical protein